MGQNWLQVLIVVLAFGTPALSWLFTKLKEQAEIKRERALRQRQREEELRTGRRMDAPEPRRDVSSKDDRATELQRLAERRQQQLRELRQRQAQQQPRGPVGGAAGAAGAGMGGGQSPQNLPKNLPNRAATRAEQARQRMQERIEQRQAQIRDRQQSQQPTGRPSARADSGAQSQATADIQAALRRSAEASALDQVSIQQQMQEAPTKAGDARKPATIARRKGVGREVRDLLSARSRASRTGPSLPALFAVSEVLAKPVSMRDSEEGGGVTL